MLPLGGVLLLAVCSMVASCAVDKLAVGMIADALSADGSNTVFTGDDDFQLVADAIPFGIKFYESILAMQPEHAGMRRMVGSMYVMYANAFVQGPAEYLPADQIDERFRQEQRAGKFYLRGRTMVVDALEQKYPGFREAVLEGQPDAILVKMNKEDVSSLYWLTAGWFGAFSLDNLNVALSLKIGNAVKCLDRAYALDPDWQQGSLDELYIQILASLPPELGGSVEQAQRHYERALKLNGGTSCGTYLAWAGSVLINRQDRQGFVAAMEAILAIDPEKAPAIRLQNAMAQKKARWYLDHLDEFFLE